MSGGNGTTFADVFKLASIFGLAWVGATTRMVGAFFRELAVLVVIFVPLEAWKAPQGGINSPLLWHTGEGGIALLFAGIVCEYIALGADRAERDSEGNRGS